MYLPANKTFSPNQQWMQIESSAQHQVFCTLLASSCDSWSIRSRLREKNKADSPEDICKEKKLATKLCIVLVHIYPPVVGHCQTLAIGRSAYFSLQ